jgi:hypothetical protein
VEKKYIVNNAVLRDDENKNDYFEIEFDPPLKFPTSEFPGSSEIVEGSLAAVCICPMGEGLTRAVIHKAERLFGNSGVRYGAGPHLIFDHIPNLIGLMEHIGYEEMEPGQEEECHNPFTSRAWEIWPKGSSSWLLTHDENLARTVFEELGDGNVKEYAEVPLSFEMPVTS